MFEASMMIRQGKVLGRVWKKKKTKEENQRRRKPNCVMI